MEIEFKRFGTPLAKGEIRRDLAPMNFEALRKLEKTVTSIIRREDLILINVPLKMVNEGSVYTDFKPGDILLAPAASSLAIVTTHLSSEPRFRFYKAGEITSGLEALSQLKNNEILTVTIKPQKGDTDV